MAGHDPKKLRVPPKEARYTKGQKIFFAGIAVATLYGIGFLLWLVFGGF